jgi:hypothetical protein
VVKNTVFKVEKKPDMNRAFGKVARPEFDALQSSALTIELASVANTQVWVTYLAS